jgi:hypothetical protein
VAGNSEGISEFKNLRRIEPAAGSEAPGSELELSGMMIDPNEMNSAGPESRSERRDRGGNGENQPRPFGDVEILYEIPRARPEDPPMRDWWIDEESGNQER